MFTTQKFVGAADIEIGCVAGGFALVTLCVDFGGAVSRGLVELDGSQLRIVAIELVVQLQLAYPATAQILFQGGEDGTGVLLPAAPVGGVAEGTLGTVDLTRIVVERKAA